MHLVLGGAAAALGAMVGRELMRRKRPDAKKPSGAWRRGVPDVAAVVFARREGPMLLRVVEAAHRALLPFERARVLVLDDGCDADAVCAARAGGVDVLTLPWSRGSRARALRHALGRLPDSVDVVVILDGDDLVDVEYARWMTNAWRRGEDALQGHRTTASEGPMDQLLGRAAPWRKWPGESLLASGTVLDRRLLERALVRAEGFGSIDAALQMDLFGRGLAVAPVPQARMRRVGDATPAPAPSRGPSPVRGSLVSAQVTLLRVTRGSSLPVALATSLWALSAAALVLRQPGWAAVFAVEAGALGLGTWHSLRRPARASPLTVPPSG